MAESVDAPDLKSVGHCARGSSSLPTRTTLNILRVRKEPMKYRIDTSYCWYNKGKQIVLMYFINQVPFTFDELPDESLFDLELINLADKERRFEPEDLYRSSFYLIDEECHPMLFEVELENPEMLPVD